MFKELVERQIYGHQWSQSCLLEMFIAGDFLRRLIEAVPYRIHTVLTDNVLYA